jgi:hypothetical protein
MDLPFIIATKKRGWITLRSQETHEIVSLIKTTWRTFSVPYTKDDLRKLTQLFMENPALSYEHWRDIEAAILSAKKDRSLDDASYNPQSFLFDAKTGRDRMKYLPQIVYQMFVERRYDKASRKWIEEGEIPAPFDSLDYSYLGKQINSKFIEIETIGTVRVGEPEEKDQQDD